MTDRFAALSSQYDLGECLSGSLSIVFKGHDRRFDRDVAIKIPNESVSGNAKYLDKFVAEAKMLGRIDHPNIITAHHFHDVGEIDERCYLVTEWLDTSLDRVIRACDLSIETVIYFTNEILKGLSALHNAGVIHRDIKPSNILISGDYSRVKIGDLGISADIGAEQTLSATPKYVAPENFHVGATPDRRSDLYSLGVLLYEMTLGPERFREAFSDIYASGSEKDQVRRWLNWHLDSARSAIPLAEIDPCVPEGFSILVAALMSKDVNSRPASVEETLSRLANLDNASLRIEAIDVDRFVRPGKKTQRNLLRWGVAISVSSAVLVAGVAGILGNGNDGVSAIDDEKAAHIRELQSHLQERFAFLTAVRGAAALEERLDVDKIDSTASDLLLANKVTDAQDLVLKATEMVDEAIRTGPRQFQQGSTEDERLAALMLCEEYVDDCSSGFLDTESSKDVVLNPFQIATAEVTNQEFAEFASQRDYRSTAERVGYGIDFSDGRYTKVAGLNWRSIKSQYESEGDWAAAPVTFMSFEDANSYCTARGARLPTEAEWEYVARGKERRRFVFGDDWQAERIVAGTDIGNLPQSAAAIGPEGYKGLFGSAWEWVDTRQGDRYTLKGGSFVEKNPAHMRAAAHRWEMPELSYLDNGFRCAEDVEQWPST